MQPRHPTAPAAPSGGPSQPTPKDDGEPKESSAAAPAASSKPKSKPKPLGVDVFEPRRFHMAKPRHQSPSNTALGGGISKKPRAASAVFVERSGKRKRGDSSPVVEHLKIRKAPGPSRQPSISEEGSPTRNAAAGQLETQADVQQPQRFKRPGRTAAAAAQTSAKDGQDPPEAAPRAKPQLPPSLVRRRGSEDMEQLARDMDAYTLEQIGLNLARMDQQSREPKQQTRPSAVATPPKKYHPKAPAKRYAERNPLPTPPAKLEEEAAGEESDSEVTGDEEYVVETYVRVSADTLASSVPANQIGLLVFDTDPDIEYFYGVEEDSEEDVLDDDDDSNGKCHHYCYGAHYGRRAGLNMGVTPIRLV